MVVLRNTSSKLMRRYKFFLFFGVTVILSFQIFLGLRFLTISKNTSEEKWQPQINFETKIVDTVRVNFSPHKQNDEGSHNNINIRTIKSNPIQLRLEELDFTPQCQIKGKEAVSAIHRAKTQTCKFMLVNITCLAQTGKLYPNNLPNYCPRENYEQGKPMGCFKDEKNYRILNGYFGIHEKNNSPGTCVQMCLQSGFPYAGVEYSNECFCGSEGPSSSFKLPDSSCNMKCSGSVHETCGGYYAINVYQTGIKKFTPQVANLPATKIKPARIVFLLTLNGRALRQVKRLLKIIYHKDHYYYIHVDVRQDYLFRELLFLEKDFINIKLTRNRFATIWGGASLLKMLLSCMKEILTLDWKWDFILNLSESDYPVKTVERLSSFLAANINRNFVKSHGREVQRFIQKQGLDKTFVECDTHMWRIADRKLPWGIQIDGGSDWVALTRNFVTYVANDQPDELIRGLLSIFHHTLLPAESFFHTVLRNSKFCESYIDNNLHVTNWKRKLGCKCQYKHVVDWCGCSPNDFKPEDWPRILGTETRQLYFARKFEPIISQNILFQLELWLLGLDKPHSPIISLNSYWQSIYHHQDFGTINDDGLLTVFNSAIRHFFKRFNNETCNLNHHKLLEVTSYHFEDAYKYTLVKFNSSHIFELAIKPFNFMTIPTHSPVRDKLELLFVSSEYDQKEQKSRNFARILSPYSDPVLIYQFGILTRGYNISCLWIDPSGKLVELSELSIDENNLSGHIKPSFKYPHLPGAWNVNLIHENILLAEIKFLITPLEYYSGIEDHQQNVRYTHSREISKELNVNFNKFLPNEFDRNVLELLSKSNAKRVGSDLKEWVDNLFNKFYFIEQVCMVEKHTSCYQNIPICSETYWSSYYPDPKSTIAKENETTGLLDIW